jgi:hypothetical protein
LPALVRHWDNELLGDFAHEHFGLFVEKLGLSPNNAAMQTSQPDDAGSSAALPRRFPGGCWSCGT